MKTFKQKLYCYVDETGQDTYGEKDESNALLRLADALAGLIREADEGNNHYDKLVNKLQKEKVVNELLA